MRRSKSIGRRILGAFIAVCLASLVISGGLAVIGMMALRNAAVEGNNSIGTQAAKTGGAALLEQALSDVTALAAAKADGIDGELGKAFDTIKLLTSYLSGVYQNSSDYPLLPFNHCRFNTGSRREMQWMLSPGMVSASTGTSADLASAGVLEETFLQGNMETLYESVMTQNDSISSIYTTSVGGVNTGYDDKSLYKLTGSIAGDTADLRGLEWYTGAERSGGVYVTDTYRDTYGRGLCVTISAPYYGENGEFAGVMGADMLIGDLSENVLQTTVGETGYAVLLNLRSTGGAKVIAAPGMDETNESDIAGFLGERWEAALGAIVGSSSGVETSVLKGGESVYGESVYGEGVDGESVYEENVYIVWAPVTATGWTFALVMPAGEITAPSTRIRDVIGGMTGEVVAQTGEQIIGMVGIFALVMLALLALTAFAAVRVSRLISRPILSLADSVKAIGDGNLDYTATIATGDEIEDLSLSFARMTRELKDYIINLASVTAEKERIGAELDVATKIQASMLPSIFPAFPNRAEFDIFASMQPAKEVGGDFYDFFLIDERTLAVVIADVSGKGVPAALFMVIAKTLIKNNAQYGKTPAEVFSTVNNLLCENNEAGMFVTAFLGYLDIPSGKFTFVNAGHNPPLLRTNGEWSWLKKRKSFVLAGMEDVNYKQDEIIINPGDVLFLYTDGVTEAMNIQHELWGEPRLLDTVKRNTSLPLNDFTASLKARIEEFAVDAEQADDITMLTLEYWGEKAVENVVEKAVEEALDELVVKARLENMAQVQEFIDARLCDCPAKLRNKLHIAVDEIFTNIASYAYAPADGDVTIRVICGESIVIEFQDSGVAFDPLSSDAPDITLSAQERELGGLGLFMVKKMMDSVEYRREGNRNILTVKKNVEK